VKDRDIYFIFPFYSNLSKSIGLLNNSYNFTRVEKR